MSVFSHVRIASCTAERFDQQPHHSSDTENKFLQGDPFCQMDYVQTRAVLGCTTTSQTDPPPRLNFIGCQRRTGHLTLKLSPSQKVG